MSYSKYILAKDLDEAIIALSSTANAAVISGGTDLVIDIKEKKKNPEIIVDISRIPALTQIKELENEIYVGSAVKFAEIAKSPIINKEAKALALAAGQVGSPQIRNMGTVGGNIANASPAADTVPALLALGAKVEMVSMHEKVIVPLKDLVPVIKEEGLKGSIIGNIILPKYGTLARSTFKKLGRRSSMAIARINLAAMAIYEEKSNYIKTLSIAVGAVGRHAYLIDGLSENVAGKIKDDMLIDEVAVAVQRQVAEVLGARPTAKYKNKAIKGLLYDALQEI